MSSCVKPLRQSNKTSPVVLLHCFDRFDIHAKLPYINAHNNYCFFSPAVICVCSFVHVWEAVVVVIFIFFNIEVGLLFCVT